MTSQCGSDIMVTFKGKVKISMSGQILPKSWETPFLGNSTKDVTLIQQKRKDKIFRKFIAAGNFFFNYWAKQPHFPTNFGPCTLPLQAPLPSIFIQIKCIMHQIKAVLVLNKIYSNFIYGKTFPLLLMSFFVKRLIFSLIFSLPWPQNTIIFIR